MAESAQKTALLKRMMDGIDPRQDVMQEYLPPETVDSTLSAAKGLLFDPQAPNYQDYVGAAKGAFDQNPMAQALRDKVQKHASVMAMGTLGAGEAKPGLNMNEGNRMVRAQKMGFDPETTYYHGTGGSITKDADSIEEFSKDLSATPGVAGFFTKDPRLASEFSELKTSSGNQVLPVHLKAQNTFDYANPSHVQAILKNRSISDAAARAGYEVNGKPMSPKDLAQQIEMGNWNFLELPEVIDAIKDAGFDSMHVLEKGQKNIAVFEPNQIRSTFAAFDPKKADSGNISAGVGIGGALGAAALAKKRQQKEEQSF